MAKIRGADQVARTVSAYPNRFRAVARRVLTDQAAIIEARMKAEHRWHNVTGQAEANLRCRLFDNGTRLRVQATQGVPYGQYLETRFQGRDAVLQPTVRSQWPVALQAVAAAVREAQGR